MTFQIFMVFLFFGVCQDSEKNSQNNPKPILTSKKGKTKTVALTAAPIPCKVYSVDLNKKMFLADRVIYKWVPIGGKQQRRVKNRDLIQFFIWEKANPVIMKKQHSLKHYRVYNKAGVPLKHGELEKQFRPGINVLWTTNAKKTVQQFPQLIKDKDLILEHSPKRSGATDPNLPPFPSIRERITASLFICRPPVFQPPRVPRRTPFPPNKVKKK